ncbi:headcase protein-like isoform X2 [Periplaneta americana]|uniref:headcase protein-like isoform X2 n=1 Tax=Periplaneta americana TaxID=6978 RepID=UPI0037E8109A
MAPRRNHHGGHGAHGGAAAAAGAAGNGNEVQGFGIDPETIENHDANVTRCCVPTGECLRANNCSPNTSNNNNTDMINLDDLRDAVKVTCNNDHCNVGQYMHRECFDAWEQTVLTYLKSCGRARSWSERQRHQNLWTKKGYDLAFKACGCRCGRGHLKKDLDWMPPPPSNNGFGGRADDNADANKKKKRRNRQNTRPTLALSAHPNHHPNNNNNGVQGQQKGSEAQLISAAGEVRGRTGSLSSSTGSSSPPASGSSESSVSPVHNGSGNGGKKKSKFEFFSDRSRHGSTGGNGIFSRRQDFSSFNSLPRHKLNSYHIKVSGSPGPGSLV